LVTPQPATHPTTYANIEAHDKTPTVLLSNIKDSAITVLMVFGLLSAIRRRLLLVIQVPKQRV
jgi:hypothetical protein